jgi:hypothetical protein
MRVRMSIVPKALPMFATVLPLNFKCFLALGLEGIMPGESALTGYSTQV